ncbi:MAG: helix-turn-helix domain-containing protein [Synechococcaceae cyanobacterium]|nr:helix-turn-helix domain-containing protein [Synechococcaceae cyanobacterium]
MPSRQSPSLRQQLQGNGLATALCTDDFGCWEAAVASTLGHHRSERLQVSVPFAAHFRVGQVGGVGILHINGRGRLRLIREQQGLSVLWLPLRGMTAERINGQPLLAEPGTGLLYQPGDAMDSQTSEELEGLSLLIPTDRHQPLQNLASPLLAAGPLDQAVLSSARQLAVAAACQPAGMEHAADRFSEALRAWSDLHRPPGRRERITARRRRETVQQAREWMTARLEQRFGVEELSGVLQLSTRQLQYSFLQELGRSPMAEAKRLRLQRLRHLLLDPEQDRRSIAELMQASGLIASGVTSADYRHWCGESPRRTRLCR